MPYTIIRGNTWSPILSVKDDDGNAIDCADYTAKMWIKRGLDVREEVIHELDILWSDRKGGIGNFKLTHDMSKSMLGKYWVETILYKTLDNSVVESLIQDKLIVTETLNVNL